MLSTRVMARAGMRVRMSSPSSAGSAPSRVVPAAAPLAAAGRARSLVAAFGFAPAELADALAARDARRAVRLLDRGADAAAPEVAATLIAHDGAAAAPFQELLFDDDADAIALVARLLASAPALRAAAATPAMLVAALTPETFGAAERLLAAVGWMTWFTRALCETGAVFVVDGLVVDAAGHVAAALDAARAPRTIVRIMRDGAAALHCARVSWDALSPSNNGSRIARWAAHFREKSCCFVHVPKCGGTSVEATLFGMSQGSQHESLHTWRDALTLRSGACEERAPFVFGFVRHPLNRFLSAFAYILTIDEAKTSAETFPSVALARHLIEAQFGACPKAFLAHLVATEDWRSCPIHFRPQWTFFGGGAVDDGDDARVLRGVDFVGKLERAGEDFAALLRVHDFGLDPMTPLVHARVTPKLPNHAALLADPELSALVRRVYERDFRLFGYE